MASDSRTILLVEDEAVIAMDLQRLLEEAGYEVAASIGKSEEVIPAVQRYRPSIVLMDVRLRGDIDGVTLAEEIFVCEDTPVVFLSAFGDSEICDRATRAGAYGYLLKPIRHSSLVATLEMALQKHRALRAWRDDAQYLAQMLNGLDAPTIGLDATGRVRFMNHAATQLMGCQLMDVKGERPRWAEQLAAFPPSLDDAPTVRSLTLDTDRTLPVGVCKHALKDGGCVCTLCTT